MESYSPDGALYLGREPVRDSNEILELLRRPNIPFGCISNTTRKCRARLADRLSGMGLVMIYGPTLAVPRSPGSELFL